MSAYTNAKQIIPGIFREIIELDRRREALTERFVSGTFTDDEWQTLRDLVRTRKALTRGAEIALSWNKDKGNTG